MRYLVIIGIAVIAGILIRLKNEYRNRILFCFGAVTILMSGLYNIRTLNRLLSFYRPVNQVFYQPEFLETGDYPDSLLINLFKGKTVYAKNDKYYVPDAEQHGKNFMYAYYHVQSIQFFLESADAELIRDDDMNNISLPAEQRDRDFEVLGNTNDMFRYCFMYNDFTEEAGNYFSYYWYYYEYLKTIRAYMNTGKDANGETIFDADELVVMWNTIDGVEEEDIYIMTKEYYDSEVAGNE